MVDAVHSCPRNPVLRSISRLCLATLALVAVVPACVSAATITGDPLSVTSDDSNGALGVAFTGSVRGEFYPGTVGDTGPAPANAGFVVTVLKPDGSTSLYGGPQGNVTPSGSGVVTGTGTPADPFKLRTTW